MARIEKRTHRGKLTPYASHRRHGGTTPVTMPGRRHDAERSLGIVGVTEPTLPGTRHGRAFRAGGRGCAPAVHRKRVRVGNGPVRSRTPVEAVLFDMNGSRRVGRSRLSMKPQLRGRVAC